MKRFLAVVAVAFCLGLWTLTAVAAAPATESPAAEESPAVLVDSSAAAPAVPADAPAVAPEDTPAADSPENTPAIESTAPGKDALDAKARQAKIYENYERLARVMEIVESRYVQPVDSDQLFEGAIQGIMGSLDPYSSYLPPDTFNTFAEETEQQFSGIGITIGIEKDRIKVVSTLEGMPAFRAGVQPGDFLMRIGSSPIDEMGGLEQISKLLRGAEGTNVTITFARPSTGKEFTVVLTREAIQTTTLRGYKNDPRTGKWDFMIDMNGKIGYIRVTKFAANTVDELDTAYKDLVKQGMKGLILDFRYNPGGLLDSGVAVADRFIDTGLIVRTQGRAGIHSESYARPNDTYKPMLPVVVLVNEFSASASEVVGGALQDHKRAILVGARTYGKGSVQNLIDLDGKGALKLTVAYYYTPSGRLVHRLPGAKEWGLEPDVNQPMSIDNQIKLREEWAKVAGGADPKALGEGGGPVLDVQLSRALDILRGKLLMDRAGAATAAE
jgi:carboxyl-terminal processing protease